MLYEVVELTSRKSSSTHLRTLDALERTFIDMRKGRVPDRRAAVVEHDLGRRRHRPARADGRQRPAQDDGRVHPGDQSRVGRQHPGLVVQVYNWVRPRDISHYERFRHYHATFYRHVEATSVTPFSERARDRALPAVLVAHTRQRRPDWSTERARGTSTSDAETQWKRSRVPSSSGPGGSPHTATKSPRSCTSSSRTISHVGPAHRRTHEWSRLLEPGSEQGKSKSRAAAAHGDGRSKGPVAGAGSLREVEEEVPIVLKEYRR